MRQFIRSAVLSAALFLTPAAGPAGLADVPPLALPSAHSMPAPAPIVAPPAPDFGLDPARAHDRTAGLAPGQTPADFTAWLDRSPANRAALGAFRDRLAAEGVERVVPLWQLVRTSSSWRQCGAQPFEVAPRDKWDNIVRTLKFVRDDVVPAIGPVEALSAYRNEALNACSDGAPQSAHRHFFALDLTPVRADVGRPQMIRGICAAHARDGRSYDAGLGFYAGRRFHVDSNGFRKWGADGRGASSPCGGSVYA
jgi:Peptidase M15